MIRDNDDKFGPKFEAVAKGTGIDLVSIVPKSPNLNPICERFMGTVRRECLEHVLVLSEKHLGQLLREYVDRYFNRARPHQGIRQQIPGQTGRPYRPTERGGQVVAIPILGGLHHDYRRAA